MLGREDYLDAARGCAEFVLGSLRDGDGRLLRTYKDGDARLNAYLEDHAFLLEALLTLYEVELRAALVRGGAERWRTTTIARFGDPERGGFFSTSADHEQLIARRKEVGDHPIPSGNSSAALGLLRLAALTGEREYERPGRGRLRASSPRPRPSTPSPSPTCCAPSTSTSPRPARWRWSATTSAELAAVVRSAFRPHLVLAGGPEGASEPPLLAGPHRRRRPARRLRLRELPCRLAGHRARSASYASETLADLV